MNRDGDGCKIERETVQRMIARADRVTTRTIESLVSEGDITVGEVKLVVRAEVQCCRCDESYTIDELVEANGCECDRPGAVIA